MVSVECCPRVNLCCLAGKRYVHQHYINPRDTYDVREKAAYDVHFVSHPRSIPTRRGGLVARPPDVSRSDPPANSEPRSESEVCWGRLRNCFRYVFLTHSADVTGGLAVIIKTILYQAYFKAKGQPQNTFATSHSILRPQPGIYSRC